MKPEISVAYDIKLFLLYLILRKVPSISLQYSSFESSLGNPASVHLGTVPSPYMVPTPSMTGRMRRMGTLVPQG